MLNKVQNRSSKKNRMLLQFSLYFVIYLTISALLWFLVASKYAVMQKIDWALFALYMFMALLSYQFFVINDINARKMNGRAMAIGFLMGFIGMSQIAISFVYNIPGNWAWFVAGILLITGYLLSAFGLVKWAKYHKQVKKVMLHESLTDELTGLFNRRAFAINSVRELTFSNDAESDFSLLIIDIDDFKLINDKNGHNIGDEILVQVSQVIKKYTGDSDSVYRWGGEEFVVMMPVTGLFEANKVAQKIMTKIANHTFQFSDFLQLRLTVSIGLAQWVQGESIVKNTLDRADKALYKAKQAGKNAVVVADYKEATHKHAV